MMKLSRETGETINSYIIVRLRGPHSWGRSLELNETKTYPSVVGSDMSMAAISGRKGLMESEFRRPSDSRPIGGGGQVNETGGGATWGGQAWLDRKGI
jgi:hypothetical protein